MTRDEIIRGFEREIKSIRMESQRKMLGVCITVDEAEDIVALLKEQEWHMLTEDDDGIICGLPGDDDQYIMTNGKDVWMDGYVDGIADGIILDSGRDIREITAWMYTPELPKKG